MAKHYSKAQDQRFKQFVESIGAEALTDIEAKLRDEEFCDNAIITIDAVTRSRDARKIARFATLLTNYNRVVSHDGKDAFEEFVRILHDLSNRELQILLLLDSFQTSEMDEIFTASLTNGKDGFPYWNDFTGKIGRLLSINSNDLDSILTRLLRTGFLDDVDVWDVKRFRTNAMFHRFRNAIEKHDKGQVIS